MPIDLDALTGVDAATIRQDVARLLRARTKAIVGAPMGSTGNELGDFTADTRPTATQVEALASDAAGTLVARVGVDVPDGWEPIARQALALRTAMLVELSYFPEQTDGDDTVYARLAALFDELMLGLIGAINDNRAGSAGAYGVPVSTVVANTYPAVGGLLP